MPKLNRILFCAISLFSFLGWGQEVDTPEGNYEFFENKGQWPNGVLYRARLSAGSIWLEQGRILYHFTDYGDLHESHAHVHNHDHDEPVTYKQDVVAATFVGANTDVETTHKIRTPYYQNYFLGNIKERWASEVYGYHHITYESIYDGIDLLFFEAEGALKYEFHIQPNANPSDIQIDYGGQQKIKLDRNGNLIVQSKIGEVWEKNPYAYQIKNGRIVEVDCDFVLEGKTVTYALGNYDPEIELIIDPELIFATYSGSPSDNFGMTATYAYDGKGYSAGMIFGNDYPVPAPAWNTTPNITVPDGGLTTTDVFCL